MATDLPLGSVQNRAPFFLYPRSHYVQLVLYKRQSCRYLQGDLLTYHSRYQAWCPQYIGVPGWSFRRSYGWAVSPSGLSAALSSIGRNLADTRPSLRFLGLESATVTCCTAALVPSKLLQVVSKAALSCWRETPRWWYFRCRNNLCLGGTLTLCGRCCTASCLWAAAINHFRSWSAPHPLALRRVKRRRTILK